MPDSMALAPDGSDSPDQLTALLDRAAVGDRQAFDEAFSLLYRELSGLARSQRRRAPASETLNTTAVVHEAYVKLVGREGDTDHADRRRWESRHHFFALAAKAMRHVLVNYAERGLAAKRGGGAEATTFDEASLMAPQAAGEVLALHEALDRLATIDARRAGVVECRFFAGLSVEETAAVLGISPATVKRDWQLASAWLYRELGGAPFGAPG